MSLEVQDVTAAGASDGDGYEGLQPGDDGYEKLRTTHDLRVI